MLHERRTMTPAESQDENKDEVFDYFHAVSKESSRTKYYAAPVGITTCGGGLYLRPSFPRPKRL